MSKAVRRELGDGVQIRFSRVAEIFPDANGKLKNIRSRVPGPPQIPSQ